MSFGDISAWRLPSLTNRNFQINEVTQIVKHNNRTAAAPTQIVGFRIPSDKIHTPMKHLWFFLIFAATPLMVNAAARPNVVLIMADDMGYECLGCNGGTSYQTPVFDQLAGQGMRFTNCYSQPICTPSRNKIMTGRSQRGREVSLLNLHYFGEEVIVPSGALPLSFQAVCGGMVL